MGDIRKFWIVIGILVVAVFVIAYSYTGITGRVTQEIIVDSMAKVGVIAPLTGEASSYGEGIREGAERALEDSGLKNIKVLYEDSKCDNEEVANVVNKLVSDGVIAIIGEICSGTSLPADDSVVIINANSITQAYDAFTAITNALKKGAKTTEEIKNELLVN